MNREKIIRSVPILGSASAPLQKSKRIKPLLRLLRVHHWTKNAFVFSGLLLSFNHLSIQMIQLTLVQFLLFCGISSSVYILNDMVDIEKDRRHPVKKFRPLASGDIKVSHALTILILLCPCVLVLSFLVNSIFGAIILIYFILNVSYSFKLKEFVIIDVLIISIGFVLRSLSGCLTTGDKIPVWFLLSVAFLTLFLGFNKRKKEILTLSGQTQNTRKILSEYSIGLINEMLPMLTSCTVVAYACFSIFEANSRYMIATLPIAVYGIFRYQYLLSKTDLGERPEMIVLRDRPIRFAVLLWVIVYISLQSNLFI
ncbi:decaprenyl-phosphate phosphoribosyltransferase [Paenibacillus silvae]|uniref:decaprenyl-phosphate phosphoribosyltransferase n=1 Tax=Paenibacillus silvae TaxID=1325358 RepID=UPI0011A986D9|nr:MULTISPECIES: decaprenyl-phosphate phosphoribosyltransferase [Paenibacillus]